MSISQGYKPLDTGEIPEEWDTVNLRNILSEITNGITAYQSDDETDYPVTRIETISDGVINPAKVKFLESISKQDLGKYRLRKGDILFSHINSIKHIAKTAIYEGNPPLLIHGMNLLLLRPNREKVYPKFLLNLLKFEKTRNRFRSLAKKAINQASINQKEVGSTRFPLPPLREQHKIASILSTVDDSIQKTDAVIEKTEMLKRGLMQRLLTRGIGHTHFKQTELGEIPEAWKTVRLEELSEGGIENGVFKKKEFFGHGAPLINVLDLFDGLTVDFSKLCRVELTESELQRFQVKSGDVLFCRSSLNVEGVGHCCLVLKTPPETTVFECHVMRARPKKAKVLPEYLVAYCLSPKARRFILSHSKTTTMTTINQSDLGRLPIALPPLHEQEKISSILFTVDDKTRIEQRRKAMLRSLKKGLMQILLVGKVRVKVD